MSCNVQGNREHTTKNLTQPKKKKSNPCSIPPDPSPSISQSLQRDSDLNVTNYKHRYAAEHEPHFYINPQTSDFLQFSNPLLSPCTLQYVNPFLAKLTLLSSYTDLQDTVEMQCSINSFKMCVAGQLLTGAFTLMLAEPDAAAGHISSP